MRRPMVEGRFDWRLLTSYEILVSWTFSIKRPVCILHLTEEQVTGLAPPSVQLPGVYVTDVQPPRAPA